MKISAYVASSIDGYIARVDNSLDWLDETNESGVDFGFNEFFGSVDLIVMGYNTYKVVAGFDGWFYGDTKVVALTHKEVVVPENLQGKVELFSGSIDALLEKYKEYKHIYVDGGGLISSFIKANLLDEITITHIPVVLGDGIKLFQGFDTDLKLQIIETKIYNNKMSQTKYKVKK